MGGNIKSILNDIDLENLFYERSIVDISTVEARIKLNLQEKWLAEIKNKPKLN